MRRLLCLAIAGFFQLSGTAVAATPPAHDPVPEVVGPVPPEPGDRGPQVVRPLPLHPGDPVRSMPEPLRPVPGDSPPRNAKALVLSVARGEKPLPAVGQALLLCDRPGGTHPDAIRACEALSEVRGDPARLSPTPGVACTLQYDPLTVTAIGIWNDRFIRFERTFGSACSLRAATGAVFALKGAGIG